jgi:hypothetical protein
MARLLKLSGVLVVGLAICAQLLVWGGRAQAKTLTPLFAAPDGQPCESVCLFGIYPGRTHFEVAREMLRQHPLTAGLQLMAGGDGYSLSFAGRDVMVTLRGRPGHPTGEVLIYFLQIEGSLPTSKIGKLRLGDALNWLDHPSRVSIGTNPMLPMRTSRNFASWYYDQSQLLVAARVNSLHMGIMTPIKHIQLSADPQDLGQFSPAIYSSRVMINYTSRRWLGFTTITAYVHAAIRGAGARQALN